MSYSPWEDGTTLAKGAAELAVGAQPIHDESWRQTALDGRGTPNLPLGFFSGNTVHDYSHLLPDAHKKAGFKLYMDHSDHGRLSAHIISGDEYVGGIDGYMDGTDLNVDQAEIMPMHRGQGLGTPLYEAMVGHAAKHFNAERWVGGHHSSAAHKLHERLTAKHGFKYEGGSPNVGGRAYPTQEAWQSAPNKDFDKKYGEYAIHLKSEIAATEEKLEKMIPTVTFPKLGVPDNRRETKLIENNTQLETAAKVVDNIKRKPGVGATALENANGVTRTRGRLAVSYSKGNLFRKPIHRSEAGPGTTLLHEDLHRVFHRVQGEHGVEARMNLARNMLDALPGFYKQVVQTHAAQKNGKIAASVLPHEEAIAHMLNYINNPAERKSFHTRAKLNPRQTQQFNTIMKRAYKHLQAIAGVADEKWLGPTAPWSQQ